jgi:Flavin containing amine oxidoreductase
LPTEDFPVGEPGNVAFLRGRHLRTADLSDPDKIPYVLTAEEREHLKDGFTVLAAKRFLRKVLDEPHVDLKKVPWEKLARSGRYEGTLLRDLPMRYIYDRSVSFEAFEFAESSSGYDSIYFTWNAADGFPWNLSDYGATIAYKRVVDGYESLPRTIADRFEKAGGTTHLNHRLVRFDTARLPDGGDGVALQIAGEGGVREVLARKLILAMPRRSLELIEQSGAVLGPDQHAVHRLVRSVVPIPLFKLALCYRRRWWEAPGRTKGQSITDLPIRQCYYWPVGTDTKAGAILVYDDGLDLDYWAGLRSHEPKFQNEPHENGGIADVDSEWERHAAPALMVHEAHRQLLIMHAVEDRPDLQPYAAAYRDWGADPFGGGANFWPVGVESYDVASRILQPVPGTPVYICGEAYSHAQGWVEGALATSEEMLQRHLGLKPPPFLDPKA